MADSSAIYLDVNGRVGVGTESPSANLEVSGNVTIHDVLTLIPSSSLPSNPAEGTLHYSTNGNLLFFSGGNWLAFAFQGMQVEEPVSENTAFTFLVKTDNNGPSLDNEFVLPLDLNESYFFDIDWGDGVTETVSSSYDLTHAYPEPGVYTIKILEKFEGGFPTILFNNQGDREKILELTQWGQNKWLTLANSFYGCKNLRITAEDGLYAKTSEVRDFSAAFRGCESLTHFPIIDTSNATTFAWAWAYCSSLTSFPALNSENVTDFSYAWIGCSSLTEFLTVKTGRGAYFTFTWAENYSLIDFPKINTGKAVSLILTWRNCSRLQSFPLINSSNVTSFQGAWSACKGLTGFPLIDTSKATTLASAWQQCRSITGFPAIDTSKVTDLSYTWTNCRSLTEFPYINSSNVTNFRYSWAHNYSLTDFPLIDTSSGRDFQATFGNSFRNAVIDFPALDLSNCVNGSAMFIRSEISTQSYSDLLVSLEANNENHDVLFSGGTSKFNAAGNIAKQALIDDHGWVFSDGGLE